MLVDFAKGLLVTLKHMILRPILTVEYPEVKRPQPKYYRGRHHLLRYENGLERCVGCALCAAACPPEAIYLEAKENNPDEPVSAGERYSEIYQIHLLRCIWCGYCEEACPEDAIVMGQDFEMADYTRASLVVNKEDLLVPVNQGTGDPPELKVNYPM